MPDLPEPIPAESITPLSDPIAAQPIPPLPAFSQPPLIIARPIRTNRQLWLETAVVIALAVLPDLARALLSLALPTPARAASIAEYALAIILRSIQVSVVVLYLMHRGREGWAHFGLRRPRLVIDVALGIAITIPTYIAALLACYLFWFGYILLAGRDSAQLAFASNLSQFFTAPAGWSALALIAAMSCANAFAEELVMRGYLIPRFQRLFDGKWTPILVATALFASYHIYQGRFGVINAAVVGLIFGVYFTRSRRLWPLIISHALIDILAFLLSSASAIPPQ